MSSLHTINTFTEFYTWITLLHSARIQCFNSTKYELQATKFKNCNLLSDPLFKEIKGKENGKGKKGGKLDKEADFPSSGNSLGQEGSVSRLHEITIKNYLHSVAILVLTYRCHACIIITGNLVILSSSPLVNHPGVSRHSEEGKNKTGNLTNCGIYGSSRHTTSLFWRCATGTLGTRGFPETETLQEKPLSPRACYWGYSHYNKENFHKLASLPVKLKSTQLNFTCMLAEKPQNSYRCLWQMLPNAVGTVSKAVSRLCRKHVNGLWQPGFKVVCLSTSISI